MDTQTHTQSHIADRSNFKKQARAGLWLACAWFKKHLNLHKEWRLQRRCEMQGNAQAATGQSEDVHAVNRKKTKFICYRCGQSGHGPTHCTFCAASVISVGK